MEVGPVINATGGLLFAALGAAILLGAPRTRTNVLFASFLLTFGSPFLLANLLHTLALGTAWSVVVGGLVVSWLAAGILLMVFWLQPEVSGAQAWHPFVLPISVAAGYLAITYATFYSSGEPFYGASYFIWAAAFWFGLVLLALRFPRLVRQGRHAQASRSMVFSLGLAIFPAFSAGTTLQDGFFVGIKETSLGFGPLFWLDLLLTVVVGLLWIGNSAVVGRPWCRRSTGLGLTILSLGLAGMLLGVAPLDPHLLGTQGITRAIGVLILVYGVLRHQLLGIDVKLRWGLSRSTIAAVFVAVFFIASEGAQILFGQGSEWTGLLAAGGLVFAIAPLQRAAERLAEKAVPAAPAPPTATPGVDVFRRAVRLAIKDRRLTHGEELDLATVAHDLGLTAPDATRIRLEVEREIRTGGEAASST